MKKGEKGRIYMSLTGVHFFNICGDGMVVVVVAEVGVFVSEAASSRLAADCRAGGSTAEVAAAQLVARAETVEVSRVCSMPPASCILLLTEA